MKIQHIVIGIIILVVFGCSSESRNQTTTLTPVPVQVAQVGTEIQGNFINASGKVEAQNSANLSTRLMGNVSKVHVKVGDKVSTGTLLVSMNNDDLYAKKSQTEAAIKQAESAFYNAEKDYNRFKTLFEKGSISEKEFDNITTLFVTRKAGLEQAKQMKNEVEAQFAYTNIRSPFDGVVMNTFIKEGDIANPGMPVISVEGTTNFEATVFVSESEIPGVKKGAQTLVFIKSLGEEYQGLVTEVSKSAKNTGGQYMVKVALPEAGEEILSGMFVNARIYRQNASQESTIMVPESALVVQGQLTGVYTVSDNNTAILRWLRTGKRSNGMVEVLSGLTSGETFITKVEGKIFNGAPVAP